MTGNSFQQTEFEARPSMPITRCQTKIRNLESNVAFTRKLSDNLFDKDDVRSESEPRQTELVQVFFQKSFARSMCKFS